MSKRSLTEQRGAWLASDARRRARRRGQWARSKARAYARQKENGLVGFLHSLGCQKREHKGNRYCRPIPVYDHPVAR